MQLIIGNKNYSSWSMRPWVLLKAFGIPFEERKLRFDFTPGSAFYQALAAYTPTSKVPVLVEDDGFAVWDTLAIAEHIAERHPELPIWPRDARQRSRARSLCAEMHAGFSTLRNLCTMNIEAALPEVGAKHLAENAQLRTEVARIDAIWSQQLAASGGPFLFGEFGAVDAYFAPVAMRFKTYGLPLSEASAAYAQRLAAAPGVREWIADSLAEQDFLDFEEPYRSGRD
ncbi:glutathione S-transferase family protein [Roseateles sp. DAIF2]|uniref:glutathione S-transferase family protein n=1 Tax=Roseateles sp. DAIF2 TaxID=2714952 RepID=UPI0018A25B7E|nr:glutathione S-transferase family protein [Roseateles sp. DAIF2]QPF72315.1 glutathione S-transferase family protein [Roseateles sp. DAIF2]